MLIYITAHFIIFDLAVVIGVGMMYYKKRKLKKSFQAWQKGE